jgi:ribA/ribD-fused uncharacterized protein
MTPRIPVGAIAFYKTLGKYGFMSNFYRRPIIDKFGIEWATNEHYFQAQKFAGLDGTYIEQIRLAKTPGIAATLGRSKKHPIRPEWNLIRDDVMYDAIIMKFTQHDDLAESLLATNEAELIEDSLYDAYWGIGRYGDGENRLGKLLMKMRNELRNRR